MENIETALILTFLAGLSTGIGALTIFFIKEFNHKYLALCMGFSAGVMIYISFAEMLNTAIGDIGFFHANLAFFFGILFIFLIDVLIPHEYKEEHVKKYAVKGHEKLMTAGLFVALGITIHNFPEGLAVLVGSLKDVDLGISLAVAVALHNIPEGIAVSIPIYYATKDRKKAFKYGFLSGLAEPFGAIIGLLILLPFLNEYLLSAMLAFVAGIMIFISFDELLPLSLKHGEEHITIIGLFAGMFIMCLSLIALK